MYDQNQEDIAKTIGKFVGPPCLFIGTPAVAWISYSVVMRDIASGITVPTKTIFAISLVVFFIFLGSAFLCRVGLGWFGGKK